MSTDDLIRFVAWNCCGGFNKDVFQLRQLGCHIAVLAEVPMNPPPPTFEDSAIDWHWDGRDSKGLALAGFGTTLSPIATPPDSGRYSLAADTPHGFGVLGIWSCPPADKSTTYGHHVVSSINSRADWLANTPSIVAGDFNLAPFGIEDSKTGVLQEIFTRMTDLGYVSIYHHRTGEPYGSETANTYFHYRHEDKGFHIDYCFVHRDLLPRVANFDVGLYEQYVRSTDTAKGASDHVPLILDIRRD